MCFDRNRLTLGKKIGELPIEEVEKFNILKCDVSFQKLALDRDVSCFCVFHGGFPMAKRVKCYFVKSVSKFVGYACWGAQSIR